MDKKKSSNASEKQKQLLIEYLKKNQQLVSGKFTPSFTFKHAENHWKELAEILNSIPGANKDWKSWRKTWQDMRSRTKMKLSSNNRQRNATGGGPYTEETITKVEEDILDIIKTVSVEGHDVNESVVEFTENIVPVERRVPTSTLTEVTNDFNSFAADSIEVIYEASNVKEKQNDTPKKCITSTPKRVNKLQHTALAVQNYNEHLKEKEKMKKDYYARKLEIMERVATTKETSVTVKQRTAESLERIAGAVELFVSSL